MGMHGNIGETYFEDAASVGSSSGSQALPDMALLLASVS